MNKKALAVVAALLVATLALVAVFYRRVPSDRTPEGAYMRIAQSAGKGDPRGFFAYLETRAQWSCFTIRDMRKKALERVEKSYPETEKARLRAEYERYATAPDGSDLFAMIYQERGWSKRLGRDLSGAVNVEIEGDRASVVTSRGTRWPFRRRENGIWGLTIFTAELNAEADKATRDLAVVTAAADDYDRLK